MFSNRKNMAGRRLRIAAIWVLQFCLLMLPTLSFASEARQCREIFSENSISGNTRESQAKILDEVPRWQGEVLESLGSCQSECLAWPKSMQFSFTAKDRLFVLNAAQRLRASIFRAIPKIVGSSTTNGGTTAASLENLIQDASRVIIDEHKTSPAASAEVEKGIFQLKDYWQRIRGNLQFDDFKTAPLIDSANRYIARIEELRAVYGEDLVSDEVLIGAGFGNLASRVILDSMSEVRPTSRALDAISLLHPLTDNALDHGLDVKGAMQKITNSIAGKPRDPSSETKFESLVLDLLDDIFTEFPREENPMVVKILMELHRAQMDSAKIQRDPNVTRAQILEIVTRKGGYTGLIMAYLSKGRLTEGEARLFYKAGGLFQLGDDLLDIQEDLRDGTTTAWTMGMRSKEDFRQTLQAFLTLQDHLEKEVAVDITDPRLRRSLQNDVEAGFKFYLISAYLNPAVSPRIGTYLKEKIPFSPSNLKSILFNTYHNLVSIKEVDAKLYAAMALYGRVFDHHFLGGQYAKWEKGQGSLVKPYNVSHWSPMFVATKFESMLVEKLKHKTAAQVNKMIFGLGIAELGMLGYLEAYTPSDTYRMLGPAIVVTGMGVLKKSGSTEAVRPWAWACLGTFAATLTQFSRYAFF